ncbi:ribosomal RNA processing protein 36 homolog isoform X1 [Ranitomeya variabilis]|uniref:ribosomal RNA processing protein 36 homolog isoform X1 n=2 Tax=Ranitomeya variabilis TaxID=490064 RepID=UPI004057A0A3
MTSHLEGAHAGTCWRPVTKTDLMDKTKPRTDKMAPVVDSSEDSSSQEHERSDTESETDTEWEQDPASSQATDFSTMSFEEIISVKNKMGTKAFYKAVQGSREGKSSADRMKADKSRPLEMSSKKPVPYLRKVVPARKRMQRDPRFDDLSGEFKPDIFEKTYRFLDDIKKKEKETLEKKLQKTRDPALREQLTKLLLRMDQQEKAAKQKQRLREKEAEFKRQQRERAQQGKKPLYLKKSDIRKLQLVDKYQELKKKGKVENFLSKKRKRNSIKDRKRLPSQQ